MPKNPFTCDYSYHSFRNVELPSYASIVNAIVQDEQGMMWIATKRGLFSYNGYNVEFYPCEKDMLESPIQAITKVSSKYLCVGRDGGLRWFDLEQETYAEPYPELANIPAVRSLTVFDGKLWIGTRDEGLLTFDLDTRELQKVPHEGKEESIVFALEAAGEKLFIGSYECLSYYDSRTGLRHHIDMGQGGRLTVNALLYDERYDCIWIGTEGRMFRYKIPTDSLETVEALQGNSYKALELDENGNLLIGTDNGLYIYNPERLDEPIRHVIHDSRNSNSLCNNVVWDIYCDRNHHVWLATDRGISYVKAATPNKIVQLPEIVLSGEGNLFGNLFIDSWGDYWLGGENGLIHVDKDLNMQWFRQEDPQYPLRHNRVRHVFEDSDREVWIATDGSIARYDRERCRFVYYTLTDEAGIRDANWSYRIYEDRQGRFWIATYQGGLFIVDKKALMAHDNRIPFRTLNNISSHMGELDKLGSILYHLEDDGKGKLYAVTQNGLAVILIEDCRVKVYPFYPYNITFAGGYLWYSEEGKLCRLNPLTEEVEVISSPERKRQVHTFVHHGDKLWFSATDGIYSVDMKTCHIRQVSPTERNLQTGVYHALTDEVIWGGEDCFVSIPASSEKPVHTHPVSITAIYSNGKRLLPTKDYSEKSSRFEPVIRLRSRKDLQLDLSSFTYRNLNEESFYYSIDGSRWQSLNKGQNRLTFANLSGGTYRLRLCNGNPEEHPKVVITAYSIGIPYPWYATPLAFACYIILLVVAVWGIVRRTQLRNRREYERKEREKSLELSNMKMDFFVNISHELKTPLSLIIAPLSRLMAESKNGEQRDALASIHQNALRLNTLIYKILDFKQIETEDENTLIRSHVELCTLLQNDIKTFSNVLKEKNIRLNYTANTDTLWLNLDILKIESCFINILSNAIKYVPDTGGCIDVSLQQQKEQVVVGISDNGSGIDEQELSLVFVRFFQGKNARRHSEGTGIGLYLVKKFIELHGGSVEIKNRQGTHVLLTIPLGGENSFSAEETSEEAFSEVTDTAAKKKLLVIDDNHEMVAFLINTFSKEYTCLKAYNGKEGLQVMEEEQPDIVIVDQMMPVMDGLEFSRAVRHRQQTADVPIIMLTAKDDMQTELESIKIGVDAFMAKPFDVKKLNLRIAQLLYKRDSLEKSIRIEAITHPEFTVDDNLRTQDEQLLERITRCVEENMENEELNVSALAQQVGVEQKRLYRKVKQLTGMSPVNYMRKLRMKKAAVLLAQQKFTVSEVMFLVGYTNASHFAKCFAEEYGMSPRAFMKANLPK